MPVPLWVFAYGSLIFRPDFPFTERRRALAPDYARRFHQGSPDHRGTAEDLGRVLTLVAEPGMRCEGIAYRVEDEHREAVLTRLDLREQGGYERVTLSVRFEDERSIEATTWIARAGNPWWLGDEADDALLARIHRAKGPSGANRDYVLRLRTALRDLSIHDPHVERIANALLAHGEVCQRDEEPRSNASTPETPRE